MNQSPLSRFYTVLISTLILVQTVWAAPPLPDQAIYRPTFILLSNSYAAGTSFMVEWPGREEKLLLTPHHLFGPASGQPTQLSADDLVAELRGAVAMSLHDRKSLFLAPRYFKVQDARSMDPRGCEKDLAIFSVAQSSHLHVLTLAEKMPRVGEKVWLYTRQLDSTDLKLFSATVTTVTSALLLYSIDDLSINQRGTSGAPVLNEKGQVVGMNVGGGPQNGKVFGVANPMTAIRAEITAALARDDKGAVK